MFPVIQFIYLLFPFSCSSSTVKAGLWSLYCPWIERSWLKKVLEYTKRKVCCRDAVGRNNWALTKLKEHTRSYSRAWRWRLTQTHRLRLLLPKHCTSHFLTDSAHMSPGESGEASPDYSVPTPVPIFLSLSPCFGFLHSTYSPWHKSAYFCVI